MRVRFLERENGVAPQLCEVIIKRIVLRASAIPDMAIELFAAFHL